MSQVSINNNLITFNTIKSGRPDLKKDGGLIRGRHSVEVKMVLGSDHQTLTALDLAKLQSADLTSLRATISERLGAPLADDDWDNAINGNSPRKMGLKTSMINTLEGTSDTRHLDAYTPHPNGVKGVFIHDGSGAVYVKGIVISEEITAQDPNGNARKVAKTLHTKIKDAIAKELDFQTAKWRQYKLPENASF